MHGYTEIQHSREVWLGAKVLQKCNLQNVSVYFNVNLTTRMVLFVKFASVKTAAVFIISTAHERHDDICIERPLSASAKQRGRLFERAQKISG